MEEKKCKFNSDIETLRIGDFEVDPCEYEEIETIYNCVVRILRCKRCGHIEIEWERNNGENTTKI